MNKCETNEIFQRVYVQVVKEALKTRNKAAVARRYELASNMLLHRWVKERESGKQRDFGRGDFLWKQRSCPRENDHLKRLLGEKDLEIAILRDL
ncbi:transposase [Paenibacillus larvae]|nr:transposase [Paenibacillus larvae]MDT2241414.1 transposase [Paenibacillus larvae]